MVSNMHVTHISLLFFGFVFGCLAYDFRQVEKKRHFSRYMFYPHFVVEKKF